MEVYFIKSGVSLILLYLAYRFLIRQPLRHQHNRFLGLASIAFSALLPFLSFENVQVLESTVALELATTVSDGLSATMTTEALKPSANPYWIIYLVGVLLFTLRFLKGLGKLLVFYITGEKRTQWGFKVVKVNQAISPFTFFNLLFLGTEPLNEKDLEILLAHEKCHQQQAHTLDSLLLELATIFFWFNPVIWLFQRDIRAEHEFIADKSVLKAGVDLVDYQHLLFKAGTGVSLSVTNNLINKVSLIKRFNMMKKAQTKNRSIYYRIGLHACLIVAITFFSAFSSPEGSVDSEPVYKEGQEKMYRLFRTEIKYPQESRKAGYVGTVTVSFRVKKDGTVDQIKAKQRKGTVLPTISVTGYGSEANTTTNVTTELEKEVERVIALLGEFIPAEKDGKPVNAIVNIPVIFKLK